MTNEDQRPPDQVAQVTVAAEATVVDTDLQFIRNALAQIEAQVADGYTRPPEIVRDILLIIARLEKLIGSLRAHMMRLGLEPPGILFALQRNLLNKVEGQRRLMLQVQNFCVPRSIACEDGEADVFSPTLVQAIAQIARACKKLSVSQSAIAGYLKINTGQFSAFLGGKEDAYLGSQARYKICRLLGYSSTDQMETMCKQDLNVFVAQGAERIRKILRGEVEVS